MKVWDFQRAVLFGNCTEEEEGAYEAEEAEGIGGVELTIATQASVPIVPLCLFR